MQRRFPIRPRFRLCTAGGSPRGAARALFALLLIASVAFAPIGSAASRVAPARVSAPVAASGPASASAVRAQKTPKVTAMLTSGVVQLGGTVQLHVEVEDAGDARIRSVPKVDGLLISQAAGPSRSEFVRYINGRAYRRSTLKWVIQIRPEKEGEYRIPPLQLEVDGEPVQTHQDVLLKVVKDLRGDELGYFEFEAPPKRIYEGEPFRLDLRFGWDEGFRLGLASLYIPWWQQMPGTLQLDESPSQLSGTPADITVNNRYKVGCENIGTLDRGGSTFTHYRLARTFVATRPGPLALPSSSFEFGKLLQRGLGREDLYERFYAILPELVIDVLPIPEEGRPFEWSGAVGRLEATRRVDRRDVDQGESIKVTVSWRGDANLEFFEPPDPGRMDSFAGFRVLGREDKYRPGERSVTYDLVAVSPEVTEIPSVDLWVFDTAAETFRVVETEPVPIRVRRIDGGGGLEIEDDAPRRTYDIRDIASTPNRESRELPPIGGRTLAGAAAAMLVAWGIVRGRVRREGDPDAPRQRARRRARARLAKELRAARGAHGEALALAAFLAARTGERPEAWVGRDPRAFATETGALDEAAARELFELQEELDRRVYAGGGDALGAERILAVADRVLGAGL